MIAPHGGCLINQRLSEKERLGIIEQKNEFERIQIDFEMWKVIKNISNGVFSPLKGFMNENDALSVLNTMFLESGVAWPFPIVFDISKNELNKIKQHDDIVLTDPSDVPLALLKITDIYKYNKNEYAEKIYGTLDHNHPGVYNFLNQKEFLIGGDIALINELPAVFPELDLKPEETRQVFKERGWKKIVAFQTRNPPHLGHEYVQKAGLTQVDGLFINPVIGKKKAGDFLDCVIIKSYQALIDGYYPKERILLSTFETEMRYAGPKEAIFHAIARKNFGCNYIIIGRDHAGVGNFYGPYDAHKIFENFPDLGIIPILFKSFSRCNKCNAVVCDKICPHPEKFHTIFSGTNIRNILNSGKEPTEDMMRPEVAKVILDYENPFLQEKELKNKKKE
jgi:sulfate adenylyltransferase